MKEYTFSNLTNMISILENYLLKNEEEDSYYKNLGKNVKNALICLENYFYYKKINIQDKANYHHSYLFDFKNVILASINEIFLSEKDFNEYLKLSLDGANIFMFYFNNLLSY